MGTKYTGDGGFTLLEVVFAVLILSVGIVGTIAASAAALKAHGAARYRSIASADLAAALESITNTPFTSLQATPPAFANNTAIARFSNLHLPNEIIMFSAQSMSSNPMTITASISWSEGNGTGTSAVSNTYTATLVRTKEN